MKTENISRAAIMLLMTLLTTVTAWADSAFSGGDGSQGNPYKIANTADLNQLATDVNGGNTYSSKYFVLTKDITYSHKAANEEGADTESNYTPIGGYYNNGFRYFSGHLDGQNHTVSGIRIYKSGEDSEDRNLGIFGCIKDATVKNVIVADARITGYYNCGGIVGYSDKGRIENCHVLSTVTIHAIQNNAHYHGGIVGYIASGNVVEGCTSAASITTANSGCEDYGGIVGSVGKNCTVSDCIYLGSTVEGAKYVGAIAGEISQSSTVRNCYYTCTTFHGRNSSGTELASDASAIGKIYSGSTVEDARLATSDDFAVSGDTYTIGSTAGWSIFCGALYHNNTYNRFSGKTVKLDKNITVSRMAGSSDHDFTGTFDGGGNTLTFNHGTSDSYASDEYAAPFCYVSTVTPSGGSEVPTNFRNLHVAGDIYTTAKYAAGLIARLWGTVNVENCRSSIVVHSNVSNADNDGTHGGFVSVQQNGTLSFTGCTFDGKLLTDANNVTTKCGGFVGYRSNGNTIVTNVTNCLYAPAALADGETEAVGNSATFARNWSGTPTNSYYTRTLGTAQGKLARSITAGENVTVALSGTATEYNVSGITAYKDGETQLAGLKYGDVIYAANEEVVSLTLSNTQPSALRTFSAYTVSPDGTNLTGTANPYTLTMPNADVTIGATWTLQPVTVTYLDANGTQQTLQPSDYTVLSSSTTGIELAGGWYVADGNVTINGTITIYGDAHLILMDNCQMNIGTSSSRINGSGINSQKLTIYGQSTGSDMGTLSVYNKGNLRAAAISAYTLTINGGHVIANDEGYGSKAALYTISRDITINGGIVEATASDEEGADAINSSANINFNGGIVTANAPDGYALRAFGNYNFNWRNATDRITIGSTGLYAPDGATATFNKLFTDGTSVYSTTLTGSDLSVLTGTTLYPYIENLNLAAKGVEVDDVTNYWTTFYCSHTGYKIDDTENACAYTATVGETITLNKLGKVIPAGTAVIIVGEDSEISMTASTETVSPMQGNDLHGVDVATATDEVLTNTGATTLYFLSNKNSHFGFHDFAGTTVPARKAFLALNESQNARSLTIVFEDTTTKIEELKNVSNEELKSDAWYSLDGRKLSGKPTAKGVYIHNERKEVIK